MSTTVHDEIREQLQQIVAVLRPYAQSTGPYHDLDDVRSAITLSKMLLAKAEEIARKNGKAP